MSKRDTKIHRVGHCPTSGKVSYLDRAGAKAQKAQFGGREQLSVYRCEDCGYWHLGRWWGIKDRQAHRVIHDQGEHADGITVDQAVVRLGVARSTISSLIGQGHITTVGGLIPHHVIEDLESRMRSQA